MVSTFFKRVARHFANDVAVVTPNGKLLSRSLDEGLLKWKQLPRIERETLEDLGKYDKSLDPAPPAGGLILKIYARGLVRDAGGRLQIYRTEVLRSREAGRDHLWLTQAEWRALLPTRCEQGEQATVPGAVVDRICRYCLIDLVRVGGNGGPRRPEAVLARDLRVTIEQVAPGSLRLRLDGSARLATYDAVGDGTAKQAKVDTYQFLGFATYDRDKKVLTRFDLAAISQTGHFDEIQRKVVPLGVAFELTRGTAPADRLPPSSLSKNYFGETKRPR